MRRWQLDRLRQWAQGLDLQGHRLSFHVLEAGDTAQALLEYARANRVTLMILGAATHGLKMQRLIATVPVRVAMDAPCSVMLVKQSLPFERLGENSATADAPAATMGHVVSSL
jgi:nucleotide-binding universal stress UspA family protein